MTTSFPSYIRICKNYFGSKISSGKAKFILQIVKLTHCRNYSLTYSSTLSTSTCHRTQCALRAILFSPTRLRRYISGASDANEEQALIEKTLAGVLKQYLGNVETKISQLQSENDGSEHDSLATRWKQIWNILSHVLALASE